MAMDNIPNNRLPKGGIGGNAGHSSSPIIGGPGAGRGATGSNQSQFAGSGNRGGSGPATSTIGDGRVKSGSVPVYPWDQAGQPNRTATGSQPDDLKPPKGR